MVDRFKEREEQNVKEWLTSYPHVYRCFICGGLYGSDFLGDSHICLKCGKKDDKKEERAKV